MSKKIKITIIGPGVVGTTLAILAARSGLYDVIIGARDQEKAQSAAKFINNDIPVLGMAEAARLGDIVLLTVSDDAIRPLCTSLARERVFRSGAIVAHCSGALTSDELMSAKEVCGCYLASMHPLHTFPNVQVAIASIKGTFCYYECDAEVANTISEFATDLGMQTVGIKKEAKSLYHASAVVACNYLTALMDAALELAEAAGIARSTMWQSLDPLVSATLENIRHVGVGGALTGPIARGDLATVKRHLLSINNASSNAQRLHKVYASLGSQTARLALESGAISPETEKQFNDFF